MAKKKINSKVTNLNSSKDKIDTNLKEINYDYRLGKIAFSSVCHNKCCISNWFGDELVSLVDTFKKVESMNWSDIFKDVGLKWERNKQISTKLPSDFPIDAKLCSLRVSGKMRLYGYRAQEYFYIVWFDKNHEICPEGKSKKYSA